MIDREIKSTINQFKRVYEKQILPKEHVFSNETAALLKRRSLKTMTNKDLQYLTKRLLKEIDAFQKTRTVPHNGISLFQNTLKQLLGAQTDTIN